MLIVTTNEIPGKNFEVIGMVSGSTVQAVNAIRDIGSGLKNLVGGEMKKYTELMGKSRDIALERLEQQASSLGADAVVAVRYCTSELAQGAAEMMVYGTAVKFI